MKLRARLGIAAGLVMALATAAQAQSSRIAFVTDRTGGNFDVWKMREDGTQETEVTDESGDARRPSISLDGSKIVYELNGDVYITNVDGSGTPANLTSSLSQCDASTEICGDPDAGPMVGTGGDFRIVFTRQYSYQEDPPETVTEIWMATFDRSEGTLGDLEPLTPDLTPTNGAQLHPAWCGSDHIVWSRPATSDFYYREICIMEVDADGPVGDPACYFGTNEGGRDDQHPSCKSDGSKVAWARADLTYGQNDIYVMDCDGTDCDWEGADLLTDDGSHSYDNTRPVWSPSGTQIAFASTRPVGSSESDGDYEIWGMNSSTGSNQTYFTDNSDIEDDDPDWGGASL